MEAAATAAIIRTRAQIQRAGCWHDAAQVISLVLTLIAGGTMLTLENKTIPIVSSLASAITSLAGLASDRLLALMDPKLGNARDAFSKLVTLREQARMLNRQAKVMAPNDATGESGRVLFAGVNQICADLNAMAEQV